jgi:hypothetical protein
LLWQQETVNTVGEDLEIQKEWGNYFPGRKYSGVWERNIHTLRDPLGTQTNRGEEAEIKLERSS